MACFGVARRSLVRWPRGGAQAAVQSPDDEVPSRIDAGISGPVGILLIIGEGTVDSLINLNIGRIGLEGCNRADHGGCDKRDHGSNAQM